MHAKLLQRCPTCCDPVACSLPGSSVQGILQARILGWVAMPSSRRSSWSRNWIHISLSLLHWQVGFLPPAPPGKPQDNIFSLPILKTTRNNLSSSPYYLWCSLQHQGTSPPQHPLWETKRPGGPQQLSNQRHQQPSPISLLLLAWLLSWFVPQPTGIWGISSIETGGSVFNEKWKGGGTFCSNSQEISEGFSNQFVKLLVSVLGLWWMPLPITMKERLPENQT